MERGRGVVMCAVYSESRESPNSDSAQSAEPKDTRYEVVATDTIIQSTHDMRWYCLSVIFSDYNNYSQ